MYSVLVRHDNADLRLLCCHIFMRFDSSLENLEKEMIRAVCRFAVSLRFLASLVCFFISPQHVVSPLLLSPIATTNDDDDGASFELNYAACLCWFGVGSFRLSSLTHIHFFLLSRFFQSFVCTKIKKKKMEMLLHVYAHRQLRLDLLLGPLMLHKSISGPGHRYSSRKEIAAKPIIGE